MKVPIGIVTRARARGLKESLQMLVRAVQKQVGGPQAIEGLLDDERAMVNVIQVVDVVNQEECPTITLVKVMHEDD